MMTVYTGIDHIDGIPVLVSKLAVITRKKAVVFEWRDAQYHEYKEYPLSERVRSVQFATPNLLILATSREFVSLQVPEGQWIDLLSADTASLRTIARPRGALVAGPQSQNTPPSSSHGGGGGGGGWGSWTMGLIGNGANDIPSITRMPNDELLLCREGKCIKLH